MLAVERDPVDVGLAISALFRGEDSEDALYGAMILGDMAIMVRTALGRKRTDFLPASPAPEEET